ncbi:MAG: hypothetical protein JWM91_1748 [Rhodospirillales bacterium]|nr:hypothetical protein [Rhodospirillales bacterium]
MGISDRLTNRLRGLCLHFVRDRSGAMAVTRGLMTSFAGVVALSVDVSEWYGTQRAMQSAADAAAVGGALALYQGRTNSQAISAATTDAQLNSGGLGARTTVNVAVDSNAQVVTAILTKHAGVMLSGLFLGSSPVITASTTADLASGSSENQSVGFTAMIAYTINYSGYSTPYLNSNYASTTLQMPLPMYPQVVALTQ